MKHWDEYTGNGGISPYMRMDPTISENFRRQSVHLRKAYDYYLEARRISKVYSLNPFHEFRYHAMALDDEVLAQQKRMQSLRNVLSRDVYEEKIRLLPE